MLPHHSSVSSGPSVPEKLTIRPFTEEDTRPAGRRRTVSKVPKLSTPEARRENGRQLRTPVYDQVVERNGSRRAARAAIDLDVETGEINPRCWDANRPLRSDLDKDAKSASRDPNGPEGDARRRMYQMQDTAARLLSDSRVCHCNRTRAGSQVDVRLSPDGGAYYGGLQTCGSVWACPICSGRVTAVRRDELQEALDFARREGLHVSLLTLTAPHGPRDDLRQLQARHREAYRYFTSGKLALKALLGEVGYVGTIRAQEVTHGANGWHPHWHTLLFTAQPITRELEARVLLQWQRSAARAGLGEVSLSALRLDRSIRLSGDEVVGKFGLYVVKWGASEELTRSHVKKAGRGGRSPWQLLGDATDGDAQAAALWAEYARCYKGQRQLVWSQGLRDLFGLREPLSDEEAAMLEPEGYTVALVLTKSEWSLVKVLGLRFDLLDHVLSGTARAFLDDLDGVRCLAPDRFETKRD